MTFQHIVDHLGGLLLNTKGKKEVEITSVSCDTRKLEPGAVFIAVKGIEFNGENFVNEAIKKGAVAVVAESSLSLSIPFIKVSSSYRALSRIAETFYGHPASHFEMTGITGTNGKSSTAFILDYILRKNGFSTGMTGTIFNRINEHTEPSELTTPDAVSIQKLFCKMKTANVSKLVMEVSSHALLQHRTGTVPFKTAVFTNLTRDHLDYHGSMENYFAAKKMLFDEFLHESGKAVINIDDEYGRILAYQLNEKGRISVGQSMDADYRIANINYDREKTEYDLIFKGEKLHLVQKLTGEFNVYNSALAVAAAMAQGVSGRQAASALENFSGVPGRLELFTAENGKRVYVDYAHTPDALQKVLSSLKEDKTKLFCIFGCGGDRDKTKRPQMAKAVESFADEIWLSDDNPRKEDPAAIFNDILQGFEDPDRVHLQHSRKEAVKEAVSQMGCDDVLLVAGKGHEDYQIYGKKKQPYCDRQTVREILRGESA